MGYFPNGEAGERYENEWCRKCVHGQGEFGAMECPIMMLHEEYNYRECNNKASILHMLIPRDEDGYNEKCKLFLAC